MAILENVTKNYFKLDLAQSFVQNNMIFASITAYCSEVDRQIEKRRLDEFLLFDTNGKRLLQGLWVNEQNAELYVSFSQALSYIKDRRYTRDRLTLPDMIFPQEIMHLLLQCGYQSEWISQPIYIVSKRLVNCGIHRGETLTAEYLYGKLKAKMTLDIYDI